MKNRGKRTYADRREHNIQSVNKRRRKIRLMAAEYKGGKCVFCGYNRYVGALDFHHIEQKSFGISDQGYSKSWEIIRAELDKCILVCANCHRESHAGLLQLPSETVE